MSMNNSIEFLELCHREIVKIRELTLRDDEYTSHLLGEAVGSPVGITLCVEARMKQIAALESQNARLRDALRFYAAADTYNEFRPYGADLQNAISDDEGQIARKALETTPQPAQHTADFAEGYGAGVSDALTNTAAEGEGE